MKYVFNNTVYNVEIVKKRNKNTYVRVKENLTILVTTSLFTSKSEIKKLLDNNQAFLENAIDKRQREKEKNDNFYIFGEMYEVVIMPQFKSIKLVDKIIYTPDASKLDNWLKKETKRIFEDRVKLIHSKFEENIPYPQVKLRKMKTRWGVCNKKAQYITLNSNLIKETIDKLDYVIVHELSHFIHFDHSKAFWTLVSKYCPKYKQIRKELRE